MALSANSPVQEAIGHFVSLPVAASVHPFQGSLLGDASGYARPLVAGDVFLGQADEEQDNSSGSAGDKHIRTRSGRYRAKVALAGTVDNIGDNVYASDDGTLTFTSTDNSFVGVAVQYMDAAYMVVEFRPLENAIT
ncbi:MAG: hypothetical protein JXA82_17920 [Sedimentisphaerales bacterium]|nr:hypothetical protein [Sedimentisphaerales bacterium]